MNRRNEMIRKLDKRVLCLQVSFDRIGDIVSSLEASLSRSLHQEHAEAYEKKISVLQDKQTLLISKIYACQEQLNILESGPHEWIA